MWIGQFPVSPFTWSYHGAMTPLDVSITSQLAFAIVLLAISASMFAPRVLRRFALRFCPGFVRSYVEANFYLIHARICGAVVLVMAVLMLYATFWATSLEMTAARESSGLDAHDTQFDHMKAMEADALASIRKPAADFLLPDLDGNEVKLRSLRGKVVLLDFWASWCGPCRQLMPEFQRIHREFAGKDVVVLAINVNEPLGTVAEYIDEEKFTFPVLLTSGTDVAGNYGVQSYPTTFAIDKNGLVADVEFGVGSDTAPRLRAVIEKARAGAPPPAVSSAPSPTPAAPSATAEDFYRDAVRQYNSKDYAGAIQSLNRALELRPGWLLAVTTRADSQYHVMRYDEAIAGFDLAIRLDPKRSASYVGRGTMYANSLRHAQAIADYTRSIELVPNSAAAYNRRGWAYLETGHLDEALADLDKALDLNPAYTTALFNRAHLFEQRKEYAKAIADFDSVLRVDPANTGAASQKASDLSRLQDNAAPSSPALVAPKLLRPADGAVLRHLPRDTTVVWGEVSGAAAYIVEWDYKDDQGWASERKGAPARIRATERIATFWFLGARLGRWRVLAVDASGADGPKSEWREFRYTR
jgi:tetratricopeptide (TPR) repeat protein/cytochrome oxidase Cu insertion factor (SCO1/SenC/PrrC family)